jgi:voltage-gated potassium channel
VRTLAQRVGFALGLITFIAALTFLGRSGYEDGTGGTISLLDAFYYATVSITTTGYGDITPVTDVSRLTTTLLVTPARVLFLILLVGTTLEVLAEGSRRAFRERTWRKGLRDHIIVCGYGTKGRSAIAVLLGKGEPREAIVIVDPRREAVEEANADGLTAIHGDATRASVLGEAGAADARAVVIAADRDDSAVLMTLTARELNPAASISASVREEENKHLLRQSGADSVITSSGAAGRLLGFAAETPKVVELLEDLLSVGEGLDVVQRRVERDQVGPLSAYPSSAPVLAIVRDDDLLRFDDPRAETLELGDQVLCLCSNPDSGPRVGNSI